MSITQSQIKGSVVLASDNGANTTIGNATGTTDIIGITNINASSGINTTIGGTNFGVVTIRGSSINIGNIGNDGNVNLNVAAATSNTRQTTIGNTTGLFDTNTSLNGKTTITKLTLNAPITSAYTVAPTSGQLGFLPTAIFNATDGTLFPDNQPVPYLTNQSVAKIELTPGTWIITGSFNALSNANPGYVICAITPTQNNFNFNVDYYVQSANSTTLGLGFLATSIIQVTTTQFYFLTVRTSVNPALPANRQVITTYKLRATRIA